MKITRWLLVVLGLLVLYLVAWPTRTDPVSWAPPKAPELSGRFQPNNLLSGTEWLAKGTAMGPEAVAIDSAGRIYTGTRDGRVLRISHAGDSVETLVNTGGRPLGVAFDHQGNVIVADAIKGLLAISPQKEMTFLATEQGGVRFGLVDDVDVAEDGTIYFSDASSKFSLQELRADFLEHRPNGRLLSYDPRTRLVSLALGDLYFANGVAVGPDQSYVLVCETSAYRIRRYWRAGPNQGQNDVFVDNLPGFPDNITLSKERGVFWLALFAPRDATVDRLMPHPRLRKVVERLPLWLQPAPVRHAFVLGIDPSGQVVHNLQDPSPSSFAPVTSVREYGGMLYLGSLERDAVGRVAAP